MKIAIIHDFLTKMGGAEKVLLSLLKIFPDASVYTLLYDETGTKDNFKDFKIIPSYLNSSHWNNRPKFLVGKFQQAIESFDLSEYDIVISNSNSYSHGVITKPKTFHLTYCHSPMRYLWDWHNEYLKENNIGFGPKGMIIRRILHKIRIWDYAASFRTDHWVSNSKNVAERVSKYYRTTSSVIYPPVNVSSIKMAENLSDDYYLIVSRIEPYKNIEIAIQAFNKSGENLVIIGTGSALPKIKAIAKKNIEFLGWQSDRSVYEYMKNARAFVFPGEEDFGITPVESMAAGRPVIALNKGGVIETVIDNKTGIFFDNPDPDEINNAVEELEKNISKFTPVECRKQAEKFSEEIFIDLFKKEVDKSYDRFIKEL